MRAPFPNRTWPGAKPRFVPPDTQCGPQVDCVTSPEIPPMTGGVGDVVERDGSAGGWRQAPDSLVSGSVRLSKRGLVGPSPVVRRWATVEPWTSAGNRLIDLAQQVRKGEMAAADLVDHALERIATLNPAHQCLRGGRRASGARAAAAAMDEAIAAGRDVGTARRLPIGVKDLEDAAGFVTSHGSKAMGDIPPATKDSALVARLVAAGCIVVGKTNTPELGWKADTDNARVRSDGQPMERRSQPRVDPRAAAPPPSPAGWCPWPPAPTAADRSGSPPRAAGSPASSRHLVASQAVGTEPPDWHDLSTTRPDGSPAGGRGRRPRGGGRARIPPTSVRCHVPKRRGRLPWMTRGLRTGWPGRRRWVCRRRRRGAGHVRAGGRGHGRPRYRDRRGRHRVRLGSRQRLAHLVGRVQPAHLCRSAGNGRVAARGPDPRHGHRGGGIDLRRSISSGRWTRAI